MSYNNQIVVWGGGSTFTNGSWAPTWATPTTPPFYYDDTNNQFYAYNWTAREAETDRTVWSGTPTWATPTNPPFYWDDVANKLYLWNGTAWEDATWTSWAAFTYTAWTTFAVTDNVTMPSPVLQSSTWVPIDLWVVIFWEVSAWPWYNKTKIHIAQQSFSANIRFNAIVSNGGSDTYNMWIIDEDTNTQVAIWTQNFSTWSVSPVQWPFSFVSWKKYSFFFGWDTSDYGILQSIQLLVDPVIDWSQFFSDGWAQQNQVLMCCYEWQQWSQVLAQPITMPTIVGRTSAHSSWVITTRWAWNYELTCYVGLSVNFLPQTLTDLWLYINNVLHSQYAFTYDGANDTFITSFSIASIALWAADTIKIQCVPTCTYTANVKSDAIWFNPIKTRLRVKKI